MLIVFDVDGTLIGGESHDWTCFDEAIETVTGFKPTHEFFGSLSEITAQAIAEASVRAAKRLPGTGLEERIRDEYLRRLREIHSKDPSAFLPRQGVVALLEALGSIPGLGIAIATGDWHSTTSFKLGAAGIDISRYPLATSSDVARRADIIKLAAQRAGRPLSQVVYIGDGVWDLRASRDLGVCFVGTGLRLNLLRDAGAQNMLEILEHAPLLEMVRTALHLTQARTG